MKFFLSAFSLLLLYLPYNSFSQTLTVNFSQLNFNIVDENSPDSLQLTITNNMGHAVNVTGIRFYNTYGSPAFSADRNSFSISNSSSENIWIKFSPRHNIFHNSEMVIENDGLRGYTSVDLVGQGRYSIAYYDSTEDRSEEDLKNKLHTITGIGYDTLMYNPARDSMFMWLDNERTNGQGALQNTLECIYTGREAVGYTTRTDCQNNNMFNTEHTWPQSLFSMMEPMRSDLYHLFPTDNTANNIRADNPFGVVTNPTWSVGGSLATSTLFEPRDAQKGKTARAMMYFALRYQNYSNFLNAQESILRIWHHDFPPEVVEQKRNHDIHLIQHNRNPFIDYPQFIERITSISNFSVAASVSTLDLTEDTIVYGFVQTGVPSVFHYVVVNNGNTQVHLTNFTLSNPAILSFQSGGVNTILQPGEALSVRIQLVTINQTAVHESLTFNTDVPGLGLVTIPVYANDSIINGLNENNASANIIEVFPNPSHGILNVISFSRIKSSCVRDIFGRDVEFKFQVIHPNQLIMDLKNLSAGAYLLFIQTENGVATEKFVID